MVQPRAQSVEQDDDEISIGGDRDHSDADAPAEHHTQSEEEEAAFMRKVRAVRRASPFVLPIGRGIQRTRFEPADGGQMPATPAMDMIRLRAARYAVETTWAEHRRVERMSSKDLKKWQRSLSFLS